MTRRKATTPEPALASRCRRKAGLIGELKQLPATGGSPDHDGRGPRQVAERRAWIEQELAKLEGIPILSPAELGRLRD